jgi:hypothetical protein
MDTSNQPHILAALHPVKQAQTSIYQEVGSASDLAWTLWRSGKNLLTFPGIEPQCLGYPNQRLITIRQMDNSKLQCYDAG